MNWLKPQAIMNSKNYLQIVFEGTNTEAISSMQKVYQFLGICFFLKLTINTRQSSVTYNLRRQFIWVR